MNNYGCLLLLSNAPNKAEEAAHYFKASAEKGDKIGMTCYGYMLQIGRGVKVDKKEAVRYYTTTIDNKCSIAMFRYGLMLLNGYGVKVDKKNSSLFRDGI